MSLRKSLGAIALALASVPANAVVYAAAPSTISNLVTYTSFGGGDIVFQLASNSLSASCPYGFWIQQSTSTTTADAGVKTTIAHLLAAFHSGKQVSILADTAIIWSGTSSAACQVYAVSVAP